ncbi:MAG TPA: hypothetical protein VKR30_06440 [Candidatus Limnocylindrales bacterium]|nr:hypothetical protein [Candidatus Limnocylindrales bacterium]
MANPPDVIEQHLRSASDAILLLVGEVEQLERHKRGVRPQDPRFDVLAKAVSDAAAALAAFTEAEEAWGHDADGARSTVSSIADSAAPPTLSAILQRWREIERQLNEAAPGSPEAEALFEEFERVRAQYMTAFAAHQTSEEDAAGG